MSVAPPKLAELHLHLYGCLRSEHVLSMLSNRLARRDRIGWERYEPAFERAFGAASRAREVLERHQRGDATAVDEFREIFVFGDADAGSFPRFQAKFDLIAAASVVGRAYRDPDLHAAAVAEMVDVARIVARDQAAEGIAHAEQRCFFGKEAPTELVDAGIAGLLDFYATSAPVGLDARLAVSLPRADPWAHWEIVRRHALGPHGAMLTGVDFCFFEEGHPPKEQRRFFDAVKAHNAEHPARALAILYHVGESFSDKSLESAVRWVQQAAEWGAHRLGHAIALGVDPDAYGAHTREEAVAERLDQIDYDLEHHDVLGAAGVHVDRAALSREKALLGERQPDDKLTIVYDHARLHEVRARQRVAMAAVRRVGAIVEVCPTSNRRIGGLVDPDHHPVNRFHEHGVDVVVASDDPGIFGTRLRDELSWVGERLGLDADGQRALADNAWRARSEVRTGRIPAKPE